MNLKFLLFSAVALTGFLLLVSSKNNANQTTENTFAVSDFAAFRQEFNKSYTSPEELDYRFAVFQNNLISIQTHNKDETNSYTLEVNQFADLTFDEFSAYYLGENEDEQSINEHKTINQKVDISSLEKEVDWVKAGNVSKVKNQGQCGACWAFGATAAVESGLSIHKKIPVPVLSEQELVDCSLKYGNHGCGGGFAYQALDYIEENGLNNDSDYKYKATRGECKDDISGKGWAKIPKYQLVEAGVDNLIAVLAKNPTSVSFHVDLFFQFYRRGVYHPKKCEGGRNHAVLAVGYKLNDKIPNFYVKNSWGTRWGLSGFFRISIGTDQGTCTIAGPGRNGYPVFD